MLPKSWDVLLNSRILEQQNVEVLFHSKANARWILQ